MAPADAWNDNGSSELDEGYLADKDIASADADKV